MKTIYKIIYFCGYAGANETNFIKADCLADAEEYAKKGMFDYMSKWEHLVTWSPSYEDAKNADEASFYDSQECENYVNDCSYDIVEATERDFENWDIDPEKVEEI